MNPNAQVKSVMLGLLWVALVASPGVQAQEEAAAEDPESETGGLGPIHAEIEDWIAQPAGLQYMPATRNDPNNPFNNQVLGTDHGTSDEFRYRLTYGLPKNIGDVSFTYYNHSADTETRLLEAGNFVFGELLTPDLYAGFANDGQADGFISSTKTRLKDWHLDFSRTAFQSTFVHGKWSIGWRRVSHDRLQDATYYATLPDLPALLPPLCNNPFPCPDLDPAPDSATVGSAYTGRGPTVGIDLDFPLLQGKLTLEGGAALSVLRGESNTSYRAVTSAYLFQADPGSYAILNPPYDVAGLYFNDLLNVFCPSINYDSSVATDCDVSDSLVPAATKISQSQASFGLQEQSISTSSDILDTYIGLRWKALDWLDVTGGFRSTRYTNVGVDLRPKTATATIGAQGALITTTQDVTQTDRSATYEGFYAGLTFRLHK